MPSTRRLGCLTWPAITATLITFFIITGTVFFKGNTLFSAGELSARTGAPLGNISSHSQISNNCNQCHTAPWEAAFMQDRCIRCHIDIQVELKDTHKLHGILLNKQAVLQCGKCHPEHRGANASLTDVTLTEFPHELLGFATTSHKKTPDGSPFICQTCHVNGYKAFTTSDCAACHAKSDATFIAAHTSEYAADCLACHDGKESINKKFNHTRVAFNPQGAHAKLACAKCHLNAKSLADFKTAPAKCVDCHLKNDVHQGDLGPNCGTCHSATAWKPAKFDHNLAAFKLTGQHTTLLCTQCHINDKYKGTPTTCISCHQAKDVHAGNEGTACENCHTSAAWKPSTFNHSNVFNLVGAHGSVVCAKCHTTPNKFNNTSTTCFGCHQARDVHAGTEGTACESCHTSTAWKPSTFNHNNAAFKLTGAHVSVTCAKCHTTADKYKGTPSDCVSCHASDDAHKGTYGTNCSSCHTTTAWKPSTFNHTSTAFQLTGKHTAVQCTQCHINGVFKGTPKTCLGCHQKTDVHAGTEGNACESCHTTNSWKPSTFNHVNAAFQLTGAHVNAVCSTCHTTPGMFKGTSSNCVSCHQSKDAHSGAFGFNCGSCHSTSAWKPATFDHNLAAFKLTGAHVSVTCTKCHTNGVFKGTPQTCYACHAADDHHAGAYGTQCNACHTTSAWKPATFDHNQSAFPLTGAHQSQSCSACHGNGVYKGTPTACASCHNEPAFHAGVFGTDCASCHTTSNWNATYTGLHTFPMNHQGANSVCSNCHPSTLVQWTCFNCHNQQEMISKHAEKNISDISNCIGCHPNGKSN